MNCSEGTGEKFNLQTYLRARELCKLTVEKIATAVGNGMNEVDGQALIREEFKKIGVSKFWHPAKFRIASDTVKSFRELADRNIKLSISDIFFIDVGPVIDQHEADYGKTFCLGEETSPIADASITIWNKTAALWREQAVSGEALYSFADRCAAELGYRLNPLMTGHRLGDFPHSLFSKEGLFSLPFSAAANLWVLEIHIVSDLLKRGAFFEDIL